MFESHNFHTIRVTRTHMQHIFSFCCIKLWPHCSYCFKEHALMCFCYVLFFFSIRTPEVTLTTVRGCNTEYYVVLGMVSFFVHGASFANDTNTLVPRTHD